MLCSTLQDNLQADSICFNENKTVAEENKRVFRLDLPKGESCCRIAVDDCFIKDNSIEKCDFWFHHCEKDENVFVELKGQNINKAFSQILKTIDIIKSKIDLPQSKRHAAIVISKSPKSSNEIRLLKTAFKNKYGNRLEIQSIQMTFKFL
jgi:hypothetical protein